MKKSAIFLACMVQAFLCIEDAVGQNQLLVIAPDAFIGDLQVLKRFKDFSGRPTTLISLSEIESNPQFSGVDQPERIKRCIAYYEDTLGVKHVWLVGDVDRFPGRYVWYGLPGQEGWGPPNDVYYADLYKSGSKTFDNWDSRLVATTHFRMEQREAVLSG